MRKTSPTKEQIAALIEELRKRGVVMSVDACGCCYSPWVKVEVDGVVMVDAIKANFDMFNEEEA